MPLFMCHSAWEAHKPFILCLAFSYWLKAIKISLRQEQLYPIQVERIETKDCVLLLGSK